MGSVAAKSAAAMVYVMFTWILPWVKSTVSLVDGYHLILFGCNGYRLLDGLYRQPQRWSGTKISWTGVPAGRYVCGVHGINWKGMVGTDDKVCGQFHHSDVGMEFA